MPFDSEVKDDKISNIQITSKIEKQRQVLSLKQKQINLSSHSVNRSSENSFIGFDPSWQDFFDPHIDAGPGNPTSSSSSHHPIQGTSNASQHRDHSVTNVSDEFCEMLDRSLERERRVRTDPALSRPTKGMFGEDFPIVSELPLSWNGFRPGTRHPYVSKNEQPMITTSYRYGNPKDFGGPLVNLTSTTSSATTLQGYRVGIGNREIPSKPMTGQKNQRLRNSYYNHSTNDRAKGPKYSYQDPVPGAFPSFQQRLIEIAILAGDTIRYERTRKVKKKAKQEK